MYSYFCRFYLFILNLSNMGVSMTSATLLIDSIEIKNLDRLKTHEDLDYSNIIFKYMLIIFVYIIAFVNSITRVSTSYKNVILGIYSVLALVIVVTFCNKLLVYCNDIIKLNKLKDEEYLFLQDNNISYIELDGRDNKKVVLHSDENKFCSNFLNQVVYDERLIGNYVDYFTNTLYLKKRV